MWGKCSRQRKQQVPRPYAAGKEWAWARRGEKGPFRGADSEGLRLWP